MAIRFVREHQPVLVYQHELAQHCGPDGLAAIRAYGIILAGDEPTKPIPSDDDVGDENVGW